MSVGNRSMVEDNDLNRTDLLHLIDNLMERIEEMPQQMKHIPLNHTDMLCLLGIMRDMMHIKD